MIEATTKRIEKTAYLTSLLYTVINRSRGKDGTQASDTQTLLQTVYLCINRLSPDYIGVELGIGESLLIKAISESTGRSVPSIKADLKKEGDLGLVAIVGTVGFPTSFFTQGYAELQSQSTNHLQTQDIDCAKRLWSAGRNCAYKWSPVPSKEDEDHHRAPRCLSDYDRKQHFLGGKIYHSLP